MRPGEKHAWGCSFGQSDRERSSGLSIQKAPRRGFLAQHKHPRQGPEHSQLTHLARRASGPGVSPAAFLPLPAQPLPKRELCPPRRRGDMRLPKHVQPMRPALWTWAVWAGRRLLGAAGRKQAQIRPCLLGLLRPLLRKPLDRHGPSSGVPEARAGAREAPPKTRGLKAPVPTPGSPWGRKTAGLFLNGVSTQDALYFIF